MTFAEILEAIRIEARKGDMTIDTAVYEEAQLDPSEPVLLGSGSLDSRVGIFGRDPGRNEVLQREPFIGKAGQLIRNALGNDVVFWANTVPYKPLGNKAWSVKVKRRFLPMIRDYLVHVWNGDHLMTCGNVAFEWFGLAEPTLKPVLKQFWTRADRYEAELEIELGGKAITLLPLPHPSPLNARWYPLFPALIEARLQSLRNL
jgi:uracil-DNA glycosylase